MSAAAPAGGTAFLKVCGAGNDFILVDARALAAGIDAPLWARALCPRGSAVGADGLLVVAASDVAFVRLTYFNADGSRAFCGNGTLCVARWAHEMAGAPATVEVETDEGVLTAHIDRHRVEIELPPPKTVRADVDLDPAGMVGRGTFVDVGCPHLVVIADELPDDATFAAQARRLRHHPALGAAGANVDRVRVDDAATLSIRVFERGVEAETLASGTGCLASALAAAHLGLVTSPVTCRTRGGERLVVRFRRQGAEFAGVRLEGSARLVYAGRLGPDAVPA
ncbi:MAG: diaminopimelate epimerase [Acidobacteriota bacterium]